MKKKLLIVSHALELGGAERSLIGLLNAFDFEKYVVDSWESRETNVIDFCKQDGMYA